MTERIQFTTSIGLCGVWSDPPSHWSFSGLEEVKACPRRFALTRATYEQVWDRRGYPDRVTERSLLGVVVHKVVEEVLVHFRSAGCASVSDERAVTVIRRLGGFTSLVETQVDRTIDRLQSNPRVVPQLNHLGMRLRRRIPEVRVIVQKLIARTLIAKSDMAVDTGSGTETSHSRGRITRGYHPEVTLIADAERLTGRVDLVIVRDNSVDLLEFKSGRPSDRHHWQLTLYGLLWMNDNVANPYRLPVRMLKAMYPDGDRSVAVPAQWQAVRAQLGDEIRQGDEALANRPPKASPSPDCQYCPVRHMCDEYWESQFVRGTEFGSSFVDIEVLIRQRNGPRSWKARLLADSSDILLRTATENESFSPGQRLRILDIVLVDSGDTDWMVATAVGGTELYPLDDLMS